MRSCADCMNIKCRCDSCHALIEVDGKWFCDDAQIPCEEIDYCWSYDGSSCECDGLRDCWEAII